MAWGLYDTNVEQAFNLFDNLEVTSGRNAKKEILANGQGNEPFLEMLRMACDPFRVYGVVKFKIEHENDFRGYASNFNIFYELLCDLEGRKLTGHSALNAVSEFLGGCNERERVWYSRIIKKDLRVGVTEKTINEVFPSLIPVFDCALAKDWDDVKKKPKNLIVEKKLDGYRAVCFVREDGSVSLYTRNGKLISGFTDIEKDLSSLPRKMVYDAEIVGKGNQFTEMQELVFKKGMTDKPGNLEIFDALPIDEFSVGKSTKKLRERKEWLKRILNGVGGAYVGENLMYVDYTEISLEDSVALNDLYLAYLAAGFEGIMAKDAESYYECKRSSSWMKMKPEKSIDLPIIGWYIGQGKYEGMLGGFVVDFDGYEVEIGGGYNEEQRATFWNERDQYLGRVIEITYQEETTNKEGGKSLRFPVFQRFRPDKE